jgi:tetratricopeptide (TPR) repeat protein
MSRAKLLTVALLAFLLPAGAAMASWYDDYDAGIAAAHKGQWSAVVQKMTSAINAHPKESDHERTYGAIFIVYKPYYYRAVANLNLGMYEAAIADFEKASGPGEYDLGGLDTLMQRAKTKLEASQAPPPESTAPVPTPVQPRPVTPNPITPSPVQAAPAMDPGLRQRAQAAINEAQAHLKSAQQRKATGSPQYAQALQSVLGANTGLAMAKTNDDLNNVVAAAQNATLLADSAVAPGLPPNPTPVLTPTRPVAATEAALGATKERLRKALEKYFAGDFEEATRGFQSLSQDLPRNGWIWAFLGASQYSQYAFEADDNYKSAAMTSFRKAKQFGRWSGGLPTKYFSRRIRKAFENAG